MKSVMMIVLLGIITGCAVTPADHAWTASRETLHIPNELTADGRYLYGHCVHTARKLQERYPHSRIARVYKDDITHGHAILITDGGIVLDNGLLGFRTTLPAITADGWKFHRWIK